VFGVPLGDNFVLKPSTVTNLWDEPHLNAANDRLLHWNRKGGRYVHVGRYGCNQQAANYPNKAG